jgi:hypothetical protein
MNSKSTIYVVFAIAIGYFLISAVPGRISMLAEPKFVTTEGADSGDGQMLGIPDNFTENDNRSGSDIDSPILGPESIEKPPEDTLQNDLSSPNILNLTKWWVIDLLIAISVYWVAKNRFF